MNVVELTPESWGMLEELFSSSKTLTWCYCMWFRQTSTEMDNNDNKAELWSKLGEPIGLLAVDDGKPVGWVAVAPRAAYSRLAKSKITAPVEPDISDVWSVTCFFVHRTARRQGVTKMLLQAAVEYAKERGARAVEGYPVDTGGKRGNAGDLFHGTLSLYLDAGFELVERRGTKRALVSRAC